MSYMNGGFRWTVLIALAVGAWLAGTVAMLQLRETSDRRIAMDAATQAIVAHDSSVSVIADSMLAQQARVEAKLDILTERDYRLYSRQVRFHNELNRLEAEEKQGAHRGIERDERRRWP